MKKTVRRVVIATASIVLLAISLPLGWYCWDHYHGAQAERTVAAAAAALGRGESVPQLRINASLSRSELAAAFAAGYQVVGYDPIGLAINAYEIKGRVANGDYYNFDAYKVHGEWQLDCCGHGSPKRAKAKQ